MRLVAFLVSLLAQFAHAQRAPSAAEQSRLERLTLLADVWGTLFLFHPRIAASDLDWGRVLDTAIPSVEQAKTPAALVAALNSALITPLADPLTFAFLENTTKFTAHTGSAAVVRARMLGPKVAYIALTDHAAYEDSTFLEQLVRAIDGLHDVDRLIVDARWPLAPSYASDGAAEWLRLWVDSTVTLGPRVSRQHAGWVGFPPTSATFNGANYVQTWLTDEALPLPPARAAATPGVRGDALADYRGLRLDSLRTVRIPTLVLVNRTSYPALERQLDALQGTNRVAVALEARGEPTEEFVLRYANGVRVRVNATMLVNRSGELGSRPDTVVRDSITFQQATLVAERLLAPSRHRVRGVSFDYSIHYGAPEPAAQTLTRTQRLYGLFKVWTVIDALYPLKDLMSANWDQMLPRWIQQAEAADSLRAYRTLLSTMASTLNDAHAAATFAIPIRTPAQAATIPARLERIEGGVVVAEVEGNEFMTTEGALSVGDRVLRIDGKSMDSIAVEYGSIVSASTPGRRDFNLSIQGFLGTLGPLNSVARVEIQDSAGVTRTLSVPRSHRGFWRPKGAPPARMLPGNIGYVSLSQINSERALDSLARAFERTDGLIIDARDQRNTIDYDVVSAWLLERPDTMLQSRSLVRVADLRSGQVGLGWSEYQGVIDLRRWRATSVYTKPIVVLIAPTQSSSQEIIPTRVRDTHRGLLVGAPTAGTNGNATSIALPGGGSFRFTGMRLLNPDGSRFNGTGAQPDIRVDRTFEGVRARRDEVLDAGVEALRSLIGRSGR